MDASSPLCLRQEVAAGQGQAGCDDQGKVDTIFQTIEYRLAFKKALQLAVDKRDVKVFTFSKSFCLALN